MKVAAYILTLILAFLTIQPVFSVTANQGDKTECCMKDKKCPKSQNSCAQTACNPLRVCVYGNFFVVDNNASPIVPPVAPVEKVKTRDDKRVSSTLSECWHPPRL